MFRPKKVAILGAGHMGPQIAGLFANVGISSYLFDLTHELALKGLQRLKEHKPAVVFDSKNLSLITPCSYDAHLAHLSEADLVIEAIVEDLGIKLDMFGRIGPYLKEGAALCSNTSGIAIGSMAEKLPSILQPFFMGLHFFNPVNLRLVEAIPHGGTDRNILQQVIDFCANVLGKEPIVAHDTPGFVSTRIGIGDAMRALHLALQFGLTVEEVDAIAGPLIGRPKSGIFRLMDYTGIDIFHKVARYLHGECSKDADRGIFQAPNLIDVMVERGWLGNKSRQGFYKRVGEGFHVLDLKTLDYRPQKEVRFESVRAARKINGLGERIKALIAQDDKASQFIWELLAGTMTYAAGRIPEVCDDTRTIDTAMRHGFLHELGLFELWDALDSAEVIKRMLREGKNVPEWVLEMAFKDYGFYGIRDNQRTYFDIPTKVMMPIPVHPKGIDVPLIKKQPDDIVWQNDSGSFVNIGDQVLLLELHSLAKPGLNLIDSGIIEMLAQAIKTVPGYVYKGLVIGSTSQHYSAGANLALIVEWIQNGEWGKIEKMIVDFQGAVQALRLAKFPVVSAIFGHVLGGGFEVAACAYRIVAAPDTFCGLPELRVGLVPAAGGTLRQLVNQIDAASDTGTTWSATTAAFEVISQVKISDSAYQARKLGFLRKEDAIVMNPGHLIYAAKEAVLDIADSNFVPLQPRTLKLLGGDGYRALEAMIEAALNTGPVEKRITAHDALIARKLAFVLTGGNVAPGQPVSEQQILDLEREAFMSLVSEPLTLARMQHMLKTGKALRN